VLHLMTEYKIETVVMVVDNARRSAVAGTNSNNGGSKWW